jgi:hypothetical protein
MPSRPEERDHKSGQKSSTVQLFVGWNFGCHSFFKFVIDQSTNRFVIRCLRPYPSVAPLWFGPTLYGIQPNRPSARRFGPA